MTRQISFQDNNVMGRPHYPYLIFLRSCCAEISRFRRTLESSGPVFTQHELVMPSLDHNAKSECHVSVSRFFLSFKTGGYKIWVMIRNIQDGLILTSRSLVISCNKNVFSTLIEWYWFYSYQQVYTIQRTDKKLLT